MHFYVKSVEILEELLHPVHHDLVVSPALVEGNEEVRPTLPLQLVNNIVLQIVFNRLRVLAVQYTLSLLEFERTKVEDNRVVLHVFFLGENDVVIASNQEVLKFVNSSFFNDFVSFFNNVFDGIWLKHLRLGGC